MGVEGEDRQFLKSFAVFFACGKHTRTDNVHRERHKHLHFTLRQLWGRGEEGRETGAATLGEGGGEEGERRGMKW